MNQIEHVNVEWITVGERRRKDYGDLDTLAESIKRLGLLHPIVVDDDGQLIAGGRRLEACRLLGMHDIPVRRWGKLGADERTRIEIEENLRRKDLDGLEKSRALSWLAEQAAGELRAEASKNPHLSVDESAKNDQHSPSTDPANTSGGMGFDPTLNQNPRGGRPPTSDAGRRIAARVAEKAEALGIDVPTSQPAISRARHHVEVATSYPFMQDPAWKQYHVLQAAEQIERLPDEERPQAAKLIDQPGIPPQDAIPVLKNLAGMDDAERRRIFDLHESADVRDRNRALTEAAKRPPMPDPRITRLNSAARELTEAAKHFPNDPETPQITAIITQVKSIVSTIKQRSARDAQGHAREVA